MIDPALHGRGWTEDLIRREETAGAVAIVDGRPRRQVRGRVDYTLRVKVNPDTQPVAMALIEAKAEHLPPAHGLEQAKAYAACKRMNVPFVFSSNGHLFVEFDRFSGLTTVPRPLAEFPSPADLRARYEAAMGFSLEASAARPLLARYRGGEATRRYYQDAAIRAVLEKLAHGEKRALLSLATGAGKTFIAVHLLRRIADAGQLRKALFVCDRDELRTQATGAFQNLFGSDAAAVSTDKPEKNARVLIATYQTLDVDTDNATANFLMANYPENYFSHIVIDECHRSAWGKWSLVLTRNPDAVQIGLTATPRQLKVTERTREAQADAALTADPTLEAFRRRRIAPADRREMLGRLPDAGRSAALVRALEEMTEYDLYDVLADLAHGLASKTRRERSGAFSYKHANWLAKLPNETRETLLALTEQFEQGGTEGLENPHVFELSSVKRAGGLAALKVLGNHAEVLRETKERLFAS